MPDDAFAALGREVKAEVEVEVEVVVEVGVEEDGVEVEEACRRAVNRRCCCDGILREVFSGLAARDFVITVVFVIVFLVLH